MFENVRDILVRSVEKHSARTAFRIKKYVGKEAIYENITYSAFGKEVENLAKYFLKRGNEIEKIAVIGDNNYRWMSVFFAALCAGKVIVPLDKGLFAEEISEQLLRSGADILFYSESIDVKLSKITDIEKKLNKINDRFAMLYDDKADGIISPTEFVMIKNKYQTDTNNFNLRIESINIEMNEIKEKQNNVINENCVLEKYTHIEKLSRFVIDEFISKILVGKKDENNIEEIAQEANKIRKEFKGDGVHLRGLIEFTNHCFRNCLYCEVCNASNAVSPLYSSSC